jgi:hypothetical protein
MSPLEAEQARNHLNSKILHEKQINVVLANLTAIRQLGIRLCLFIYVCLFIYLFIFVVCLFLIIYVYLLLFMFVY